ncbi:hypothetical protein MIR68_009055 [Amoeboaphelidium protococcarum]|nr:hypothetical protein MIR68_009055 [Amoeboaphelidium protococcarum]
MEVSSAQSVLHSQWLARYNPQYIVINKRRKEAYVTLNSRLDAENLMQDALARGMFHERVQFAYASNYGLESQCVATWENEIDRRSGIFTLSAARILEDENPTFRIWAAREIGRSGLEPNFRYVRRSLTHHQLTLARKFGDLWLGGFVIEEPYKPRGDYTAPFHISFNIYDEPFEEYGVTCQLAVSNFLAQASGQRIILICVGISTDVNTARQNWILSPSLLVTLARRSFIYAENALARG